MCNIPKRQQENKNIIEFLVSSLHNYKEINRNIEFENFLILQSKIESGLISRIKNGQYTEIFTPEIIKQINYNICGNFIEDILGKKRYSLESFYNLKKSDDFYTNYPFNNELAKIKDRECLFLPLYALANNFSYEKATSILADYFNIEYVNCVDVEAVFEKIDSKMKASNTYCLYDFYNKDNQISFSVEKLLINKQIVLLTYNQNSYKIPNVLTLFNHNLIHYNPNASIFLTDSIPLAFEQQKKYTEQYIREKLEKQKKYWKLEKEEFNKASKLYHYQDTEVHNNEINPFSNCLAEANKVNLAINNMLSRTEGLSKYKTQSAFYLQTDIVWTAWYKELLTVKRVDWSPLQNRKVNYVHFGELDKNSLFEKMLTVYAGIYTKVTSLELQFIYLPGAANTIEKNKNGGELYSPDELLMAAHNVGVAIPEILQDKLEELLRKLRKNKKERFIFDPIIGHKSFNLLLGKRGAGKSWVGISIAYSLATGRSFIKNWNINKPCKVLYVNGEVDKDLMDDRCYIIDKMYGKGIKKKNALFLTDRALDLTTEDSQIRVEKYLNTAGIKDGDTKMPVSVLILDNLYFLALNAEKEKKWDILKDWILKLINERKLSVLLLHHSNEENRSFGTSNIEKVADDILLVKKVKRQKNDKNYLKVSIEETKNKRKLEFEKFEVFLDTGKRPRWIANMDESKETLNWKMVEPEKRKTVLSLKKNNTWPEIADIFNVSPSTVEKYAKKTGMTKSNR